MLGVPVLKENMTTFFGVGGNPLATPVGQKIEQATDASLASENWALNMEICDILNETEDGPKDAIKAIRKRLQQATGKNYTVVMYTLTVLETCVKNCGKRFHVLVCHKEFISELVKLIGPKNEPPTAVQEKVLNLIQSWADAFRNHGEMAGVVQIYQELKAKGIDFPMTDLDSMAPIHTPQKATTIDLPAVHSETGGGEGRGESPVVGQVSTGTNSGSGSVGSGQLTLNSEQLIKLKRELDIVQNNITVFGEMLSELTPASEHPSDWQLLQELYATCKEMQERLVELISRLTNDEVTAELLHINDLLNNHFLRYSRYEKNREAALGARESGDGRAAVSGTSAGASLIDLGDDADSGGASGGLGPLVAGVSTLGLGGQLASLDMVSARSGSQKPPNEDSEFDMFAQSRNVTYESSKIGGSTYESNRKPDQVSGSLGAAAEARALGTTQNSMHKESDFDEMAAWLGESGGGEESLTSSEFERFLAERAAAAESLPSSGQQQPSGVPAQTTRTTSKKEPEESSLFAL